MGVALASLALALPARAGISMPRQPHPSFACHEMPENAQHVVDVFCRAICAYPPKTYSARELVAFGTAPKEAIKFSKILANQDASWHRQCDKKTS